MMDRKLKSKWVEALRSGKYKQGRRHLRSREGFCCLGVLCDVSGEGEWSEPSDSGVFAFKYRHMSATALPPTLLRGSWFPDTSQAEFEAIGTLIVMNDGERPFSEIADTIDRLL